MVVLNSSPSQAGLLRLRAPAAHPQGPNSRNRRTTQQRSWCIYPPRDRAWHSRAHPLRLLQFRDGSPSCNTSSLSHGCFRGRLAGAAVLQTGLTSANSGSGDNSNSSKACGSASGSSFCIFESRQIGTWISSGTSDDIQTKDAVWQPAAVGTSTSSRQGNSSRVLSSLEEQQYRPDSHSSNSVANVEAAPGTTIDASPASHWQQQHILHTPKSNLNGSVWEAGDIEKPPEFGLVPQGNLGGTASIAVGAVPAKAVKQRKAPGSTSVPASRAVVTAAAAAASAADALYPASDRKHIRSSWARLMRWSRAFRRKDVTNGALARNEVEKVVVFGGGSFGTAIGVALARQKADLKVFLLLRDPCLCKDINELHCNTRYLKDYTLPPNVIATTSAAEAISGAQYAIHAVPVQSSRAFLKGIKELLAPTLPIISVSKGVEVSTGKLMSNVIPSVLGRKQPTVFLSGPSFAKEVMDNRPTGVVAASKDRALARRVQALLASPSLRVNITDDVVGVEICGALKNVLAIAAGIVEGLSLGHNAMAALISQGCSEIRWLAEKMHAKSTTISGLSGLGDIMLTCYGSLSRNRAVGVRLGQGEKLKDILASSNQVAEGVATAGVVVSLARKYRVQLPVLTAVAQVLDGHISAREAVFEIMNLPQIEER